MSLRYITPIKGAPSSPFTDLLSTSFDGVSAYATAGDVSNLNPSISTPFSMTMWVKRVSGTGILVSKVDAVGSGLHGYYLSYDATFLNFYIGQLSNFLQCTSASVNTPAIGSWHFIGLTYDGSGTSAGVNFYLDGAASAASFAPASSGNTTNSADFRVSGYVGGLLSANLIDEVGFWTTVLSPSDMTGIYNAGVPTNLSLAPAAGSLQNWWRMGDGDTFPTLTDVIGGSNLTMINMVSGDIVADVP